MIVPTIKTAVWLTLWPASLVALTHYVVDPS